MAKVEEQGKYQRRDSYRLLEWIVLFHEPEFFIKQKLEKSETI